MTTTVAVGQRWRDRDKRATRIRTVVGVEGEYAWLALPAFPSTKRRVKIVNLQKRWEYVSVDETHVTVTRVQADALLKKIRNGYRDLPKSGWPPYKMAPWDDRNVYTEWIEQQIEAMVR